MGGTPSISLGDAKVLLKTTLFTCHAAAPGPSLEHSRGPWRRPLAAGRSFGLETAQTKPVLFFRTQISLLQCARGQYKPSSPKNTRRYLK